jgi:O-antigen/teichoic acid export membrane protein
MQNFSYAITANILTALVTIFLALILPKFVGIVDYSYWQLYLFYISYVGFFHFGWADGIYLRYGGKHYDELDKPLLSSQFWLNFILQLVLMLIISLIALMFVGNGNQRIVLVLVGVNCLLLNSRAILQFILQGTNRVRDFSRNQILERSLFFVICVIALVLGVRNFEVILGIDIFTKIIMLLALCYTCSDIVLIRPITNFATVTKESWNNISVGIKLLLANIASLLTVGLFRFCIERQWDVVVFGKISLIFSIASILLILVSAASVVLFPLLKRLPTHRLPRVYIDLRTLIMSTTFGLMILYFPIRALLGIWLPEYKDILASLFILMPLSIYETKNQLLINTYLKVYRKEKYMLYINLFSAILSGVIVFITVFILHDITWVLFGLLASLVIRSILAETTLSRIINVGITRNTIYELILVSLFVLICAKVGGFKGMAMYSVIYIMYLLLKKSEIFKALLLISKNERGNYDPQKA